MKRSRRHIVATAVGLHLKLVSAVFFRDRKQLETLKRALVGNVQGASEFQKIVGIGFRTPTKSPAGEDQPGLGGDESVEARTLQ